MPDSSTILLVDDEDSIQKLLTYPLEREGFKVVPARDGEEALRRFDEEDVDLVVLDLMLPKLDGLEVCKRLRASSSVPIIMLTARDDELDKVLGLELGADDYITKPFSIREFRSRVRALLRRASAPRHDPRGAGPIETDGLRIDLERRLVQATARTSSSRTWSSSSCARWPRSRDGCSRARCCSSLCGEIPPTASRARSTSTSATCGRSSRSTRRVRVHPDRAWRRLPLQGPMKRFRWGVARGSVSRCCWCSRAPSRSCTSRSCPRWSGGSSTTAFDQLRAAALNLRTEVPDASLAGRLGRAHVATAERSGRPLPVRGRSQQLLRPRPAPAGRLGRALRRGSGRPDGRAPPAGRSAWRAARSSAVGGASPRRRCRCSRRARSCCSARRSRTCWRRSISSSRRS